MSEIRKITDGYVIQRWDKNTGKFLGQEFIAGTNPEYEDEQGNNIDEIEPEYVYALSYKGYLLFELGRVHEALEYYNKSLEIDPNNARALYYKSKILYKLEKGKKISFLNKFKP